MAILDLSTISHQNNVDKVDKSGKCPLSSPKFFLDVPYSFIYNRAVSGFTGDSMPEPATISVSRGGGGAAVTFFPDT